MQSVNSFEQCLKLLEKYCGFDEICPDDETRYDLTCKAALCLIAMDCDGDRAQSYVQSFVNDSNDIEKYGDLWFQVAEKYLAAHHQFGEGTRV